MNKDERIKCALGAAGIPSKYHRRDCSLASLPEKPFKLLQGSVKSIAAIAWEKSDAQWDGDFIRWCFSGERGLEAMYLFARALVLNDVGVRIFTVPEVFSLVLEGNEDIEEWQQAPVVIVIGLTEKGGPRLPGPEESILRVQWFLRKQMDSDKLVMFHCEVAPKADSLNWWGASFMREVQKATTLIIV